MGKHPGKTPEQRRALDAIGCGNHSPIMSRTTREALLRAGLIVKCGDRQLPGLPRIVVAEYDMPIPVHMEWCAAVGADEPSD